MRRTATLVVAAAFFAEAGAEGLYSRLYTPLPLHEVIGLELVTPAGERLGPITDLLFEPSTLEVRAVAAGGARYDIEELLAGERPGEVVVADGLEASAGSSAFVPITAGKALGRALELGPEVSVDLRSGRLH